MCDNERALIPGGGRMRKALTRLPVLLLILALCPGCDQDTPQGFAGSGTLEAVEVVVSALINSQIVTMAFEEGEKVRTNDTLVTLDVEKLILERRKISAGIDELKASEESVAQAVVQASENLANTERHHRRIKVLFNQGSSTQQQFDDVSTRLRLAQSQLTSAKAQEKTLQAKVRQLEASLALIERQIADGTVTSPLDGIIVEKYVEAGEFVPAGGSICKIVDMNRLWIKIYMAEADLGRFSIGDSVRVEIDAYDNPLTGTISWISPEAEFTPKNVQTRQARAELVYAVKVTIDDAPKELKIGMPAEVYFIE